MIMVSSNSNKHLPAEHGYGVFSGRLRHLRRRAADQADGPSS